MARIDCKECEKYSFNLRTGKRNEYEVDDDKFLPILRNAPPPCERCPKKSPENGEKLKLTWANRKMLDFYQRYKSVPNMQSKLLDCPITQRNIRLIDQTMELAKAKYAQRARRRAKRERER